MGEGLRNARDNCKACGNYGGSAVRTRSHMEPIDALRVGARALGLVGLTGLSLSVFEADNLLHGGKDEDARFAAHRQRWIDGMVRLLGLRIETMGAHPLPPPTGGRLVLSNHRSALDIAVLMHHFPSYFLSRGDIADWPILGPAARRAGTIFVDREAGQSRVNAVRVIRSNLAKGRTITAFPEGTTFPGDEVRELHPGSLLSTRDLDVEIVPVGLAYEHGVEYTESSFTEHLAKVAKRGSTRVVANIGTPFRTKKAPRELAKDLRVTIQTLVHEARERLESTR
jgi:1-acyl-sn-glycerol-3-phosphate acyltransferase